MKHSPINYSDYLKVPELLSLQSRRSEELGRPAHDELLFITVHQTYELWFKQIIFEIDSVLSIFRKTKIEEKELGVIHHRLGRVIEIMRLLIDQVNVLETMTALDFLEFRDVLYPASGFQSGQWRQLEIKLGLKRDQRLTYNNQPYQNYLGKEDAGAAQKAENDSSLFDLVDAWLSRTPFLENENFKFWDLYREAVEKMSARDREVVANNPLLTDEFRKRNLEEIDKSLSQFAALFDETKYKQLQADGQFRLSYRAVHAALLVSLYRDEPVLHLPYQILFQIADIDERLTMWRYRHALMAHRMLGAKIGTGGSSGHKYLAAATEKHRVFADLFNLTTFFIPRSELPELPANLQKKMGFRI